MKTLVDEKGKKFFLVPVDDFTSELEDLIDGYISRSRENEKCIGFEEFIKRDV